jgi:hypothetical protein
MRGKAALVHIAQLLKKIGPLHIRGGSRTVGACLIDLTLLATGENFAPPAGLALA